MGNVAGEASPRAGPFAGPSEEERTWVHLSRRAIGPSEQEGSWANALAQSGTGAPKLLLQGLGE
jgi:hypothetical protein